MIVMSLHPNAQSNPSISCVVSTYVSYVRTIEDTQLRKECLQLAKAAGLDVAAITRDVVETIRTTNPPTEKKVCAVVGLDGC